MPLCIQISGPETIMNTGSYEYTLTVEGRDIFASQLPLVIMLSYGSGIVSDGYIAAPISVILAPNETTVNFSITSMGKNEYIKRFSIGAIAPFIFQCEPFNVLLDYEEIKFDPICQKVDFFFEPYNHPVRRANNMMR